MPARKRPARSKGGEVTIGSWDEIYAELRELAGLLPETKTEHEILGTLSRIYTIGFGHGLITCMARRRKKSNQKLLSSPLDLLKQITAAHLEAVRLRRKNRSSIFN